MSLPALGDLTAVAALDRPDLLAESVSRSLGEWKHRDSVAVFEIDPGLADTAALTQAYGLPLTASANCVVVGGRRGGVDRVAACVVRADMRVHVNTVVRRRLDVRKASFLPTEHAVEAAAMEYGGITPIGIPDGWLLLIAAEVAEIPVAVVGSGVRRSKLLVPGPLLADLPGAEIVGDLAS
ncbi:MAG: YbaK/EbsC family protein [Nocardioidaceae bacterium]